ncbi:NADAR family protein [Candidatus Gracilibacteria bacterium]|nr:NADAR family protein [Candidatus Gracilibacteria bacterium]
MNNQELKNSRQYAPNEIQDSAIIMHPTLAAYNITTDQIAMLFEEGSNFTQLTTPIYDEYGNEFRDSEGYYMAARTTDIEIKKMISFLSIGHGLAKKSSKLFELDNNSDNRIMYMRDAIKKKFDSNPDLKQKLIDTGDLQIIEYTYRGDRFFGIDQSDLIGSNILGKLLMEYRDSIK